MEQQLIISTSNLTKIYQMGSTDIFALNRVNLNIYRGQLITIMGVSGSGKSTLLHIMGGIDNPTAGSVRSCGKVLQELSYNELADYRRKNVGLVFQFENLSPILTARENIEFPMKILGLPLESRKKRVNELLDWVNMKNRASHPPHALSGGERQRIAVLIALANDPDLILADEPTGELDSGNTQIMADLFKRLNDEFGKTILIVTHNPQLGKIGDKILEMNDGQITGEKQVELLAQFCSDCNKTESRENYYCSGCGKPL